MVRKLIFTSCLLALFCADCWAQNLIISYENVPDNFVLNKEIKPLSPTNTGEKATGFSVSPDLSAIGFKIDPTTGIISGTPTKAAAGALYTITAKTANGSVAQASIKITIVDQPKPNISYQSPDTYTVGVEIAELSPSYGGGQATKFSIDPKLPDGLVLSPSTGVIIGTPMEASDANEYTITATNETGKVSAKLVIAIKSSTKSDSAIAGWSLVGIFLICIGIITFLLIIVNKSDKDKNEALGLPSGSVRAIIAIFFVVFFMLLAVVFYFDSDTSVHNTDLSKQIITILGTLVTAVSAFYFGSKASEQAQSTTNAALQNLLQNQGTQQGQQIKITVSLDPTVTGSVEAAATGAALNNTSVQMTQGGTNTVFHGSHLAADPNGVFTFTGLPVDSYTITGTLKVSPALPPESPPDIVTLTQTITNQHVPPGTPITLNIK